MNQHQALDYIERAIWRYDDDENRLGRRAANAFNGNSMYLLLRELAFNWEEITEGEEWN